VTMRSATDDEARLTTVLIADDDPAVLRALGRMLSRLPVEVITATDGQEALERLRERRVDILVSDIDMPKLDGLFLMRAARRESPATWRILVTGAATMARTIEAINHGEVVRFFTKPIDPAKLVEEMTLLIARVEQQRRTGVHELQSTRRQALYGWVAERFPGAEQVEREGDGTVTVDLERVQAALAACGPAARALVGLTDG
jgi:DNA-binding NtrC family response regulator